MEISTQTSSFQALSSNQKPITTPVEPPKVTTYSNEEVYEASQGNAIRNDGELTLTPQGETNRANSQADQAATVQAETQAQKDAKRENGADYLSHQSNKSQAEIYLAVATDDSYDNTNSTATVIETLRDVQKQNNAVQAYAVKQENQLL